MASTKLTKTFSGNGSATTHTLSMWVKRSKLDSIQRLFFVGSGSNQYQLYFTHLSGTYDNLLQFEFYGGGANYYIRTNRSFKDTSAWYHIVAVWDTTNATSGDRMRLYVNGVRETDFDAEVQPTQNFNGYGNQSTYAHIIGATDVGAYYDGLMSHVHSIDGTAYDASTFGETDSTTGEWKIKTNVSATYGTNGFFILKDGNSVTDQSGNTNNFTVGGGTLTNTEDNPSNVFCTANALDYNSVSHSNGNTKLNWSQSAGNFAITTGTIGMTTGKYYWEAKVTSDDNSTGIHLGVLQTEPYISRTTSPTVNTSLFYGLGIRLATNKSVYRTSNGTDSSISDTWSNNSVIRIAYDGDAGKIYMWKDATEFNGQTFSSNTSFNSATLTAGTMVLPFIGFGDGGSGTKTSQVELNFGNGYFGSTAISSEGTNASGIGKFEYDVPTGYTALSTKGLNE